VSLTAYRSDGDGAVHQVDTNRDEVYRRRVTLSPDGGWVHGSYGRGTTVRPSSDADTASLIDGAALADAVEPVVVDVKWERQEKVRVLRRWEGTVTSVGPDSFVAVIVNLDLKDPDHEAEFDLEEVSPSDRELVAPGAVFYWTLGYRDKKSGQRSRESLIRFRRLPGWSSAHLDEVREEAKNLIEQLGWNARDEELAAPEDSHVGPASANQGASAG
jgi:hypothetical protein